MMMTDPIATELRNERLRRGWSQTYLSQLLGRQTCQTVYRWEQGIHDPCLSNLSDWADALGYDLVLVRRPDGC